MSAKGRAAKAAWAARAGIYNRDLTDRIADDAKARMDAWEANGRIPLRVRITARLAGRPLRSRGRETQE